MAIVENFYNGDMARPIREIITKNFANVAKYIPNNFISLTTMERQNLSDDYKTHFKLVFDKGLGDSFHSVTNLTTNIASDWIVWRS